MRTQVLLLFIAVCLILPCGISAQINCGTDFIHERMMLTDTTYRNKIIYLENRIQTIIQNRRTQHSAVALSYTIPVVVHVIHLGEPLGTGNNISDAQIQGMLNVLDNRFRNFYGGGVDVEIDFCLAIRDPYGCPTNGISRVDGSGIANYTADGIGGVSSCGASPTAIKDLSRWPTTEYYNIWVVNKICGASGYASYPNGSVYDGSVIDRNLFISPQWFLTTHETGHWLNLMHTFQGDGGNTYCPIDTNCLIDGDKICDTPPHKQGDCGSTNPCSGNGVWDNTRWNYLTYCASFIPSSGARFTSDQKDRMQATMLVAPRASLANSLGCVPGFNIAMTKTDFFCYGECIGTATATPTCPSTYTYNWSNGAITQTISGLCAGTYAVTITNANNITVSVGVTITQQQAVSPPLSIATSQTNISCGINGSATVTATGGIAPYTYNWSNGGTSATITNLVAGNYTVTVTSDVGLNPVADSPLCTPATNNYCCGIGIFNVTFNTINKTSNNGSEGYRNFDTLRTNVDIGQTYALSVTTGSAYDEKVSAWIDYNKNGVFEGTELVLSSQNTLPNRIHTSNVAIPANASVGALRMRVGSDFYPWGFPESCTAVEYGQFEDYTVFVRGAVGCSETASVTITTTSNPNGGSGTWTWTGAISNDWFEPCNWDRQSLPDGLSDVVIPGGTTYNPTITGGTANCKTVTVNQSAGAILTLDSDAGGLINISQ